MSPFEFYKEQNGEQYSLPNRQQDSNKILDKNGGEEKCETGEPEQRDMGISFRSWDHNYHRIPSEFNECDSRSGVQGKDGLFRIPKVFSQICRLMGTPEIFLPHVVLISFNNT